MLREAIEEAKLTVDFRNKTRLALNMNKTANSTLNSHLINATTNDLSQFLLSNRNSIKNDHNTSF